MNDMRSSTKKQMPQKDQTDILELKNTITKLTNSIESFKSRLNQTEERIKEYKDKSFAIIQSEKNKEKGIKKEVKYLYTENYKVFDEKKVKTKTMRHLKIMDQKN